MPRCQGIRRCRTRSPPVVGSGATGRRPWCAREQSQSSAEPPPRCAFAERRVICRSLSRAGPRAQLCVTEGTVSSTPRQSLAVNDSEDAGLPRCFHHPLDRGRLSLSRRNRPGVAPRSGEVRRQLGLKLRAQDACNLVYAMWRLEPESKLVVSVKSNAGQHTSAECGNRGYTNIKPRRSHPVPVLRPGDSHRLFATMTGSELQVFIDGHSVWEGSVGHAALDFDGPVGIRSDNTRLELGLRVGPRTGATLSPACPASAGSSD